MLGGVPNLAMAMGYTNASWTLKVDLISSYVCRLLNYLDEHGYATCTPTPEASMRGTQPFLNLTSGYVQRSLALWPKQGSRAPWRLNQSYLKDLRAMRFNRLDDGSMRFGRSVRQPLRETV
jgi:monooxygenase